MDTDPDPEEAARRLRAAIAYAGMSQTEAANALGVSIPTLARMLGRKGADGIRSATWSELWRAADALGLPRAWFSADIRQLSKIVPDNMPTFPNDVGWRTRPSDERDAALTREEQALRREAQRSRERQQAARRTKRAPRRRLNEDG